MSIIGKGLYTRSGVWCVGDLVIRGWIGSIRNWGLMRAAIDYGLISGDLGDWGVRRGWIDFFESAVNLDLFLN